MANINALAITIVSGVLALATIIAIVVLELAGAAVPGVFTDVLLLSVGAAIAGATAHQQTQAP